jgi:hypothetical protein
MAISKRNSQLAASIAKIKTNPTRKTVYVPKTDTVNRQGFAAYKLDKFTRLLTILNVSKVEDQFYRTQSELLVELKALINECAKEDAYFTAQCIVWSRCLGEKMRTINHIAGVLMAKHIAGTPWGKRFYSLWDKKNEKGGLIYRPDDISEMLEAYIIVNGKSLSNPMRKGFASALERMDAYQILKYKNRLIDAINLSHPDMGKVAKPGYVKVSDKVGAVKRLTELCAHTKNKSRIPYYKNLISAIKTSGDTYIPAINAVMLGISASADTHEVANSEAGQLVSDAIKSGKLTHAQAEEVLTDAKASNWASLLEDGKLGILAAIRNVRNILENNPKLETVKRLCELVSNGEIIRNGGIFPYQIDLANEICVNEVGTSYARDVSTALMRGYMGAVPNLSRLMPGRNLVIVDMSGSMNRQIFYWVGSERKTSKHTCSAKASLMAATIAKATNADIIRFGGTAEYFKWNPNSNVFEIASSMIKNMGSTDLGKAWELATKSGVRYDRVIIISDYECNGKTHASISYKNYVMQRNNPYVYSVDLAGYGTAPIKSDKVSYHFGSGYAMFEDMVTSEFNPASKFDKIRSIVI